MRTDLKVDWSIPPVQQGWLGHIEKFFGAGKTKSESLIEALTLFIVSTLLYFYYQNEVPRSTLAIWQIIILTLLALDLIGGIITNSTNAAKRSYHQKKESKGRLIFILFHNIHLMALAFIFLNDHWMFFITNSLMLIAGALAIEYVAIESKRPLAMLLFMSAVGTNALLFKLPTYLELFPTLFYLKLFVCFLVTEVPAYANRR